MRFKGLTAFNEICFSCFTYTVTISSRGIRCKLFRLEPFLFFCPPFWILKRVTTVHSFPDSRSLFPVPGISKIPDELQNIYLEHEPPGEVQSDQGGEFKGAVKRLCALMNIKITYSRLVQSLNSPFFPPHIGAEPGRAKEESRITCMRVPRKNQSKITRSQPRRSRQCVAQCLFQLALWKKTFSLALILS